MSGGGYSRRTRPRSAVKLWVSAIFVDASVWVDYVNLSQFLSLADLFVSKIIIGCTVWVHFSFKHKGLLLYINFVCYPRKKWKLLSALSLVRDLCHDVDNAGKT